MVRIVRSIKDGTLEGSPLEKRHEGRNGRADLKPTWPRYRFTSKHRTLARCPMGAGRPAGREAG